MRKHLFTYLGIAIIGNTAPAQEPVVVPSHHDGVYMTGETIQWQISAPDAAEARFAVLKNGFKLMNSGTLSLVSGSGVLKTTLNEPGTVMIKLVSIAQGKETKTVAGAAVEPAQIKPFMPRPADFDAFWNAKINQAHTLALNPIVQPAESGSPDVDYFKVTLENISGTHVYGQLAKPKHAGRFPALLIFQGAGVYALPKQNVISRAQEGWLTFNIMAHDLPIDYPADYYQQLEQTTFKDYYTFGNDDREKSYFLRMFLGCYRAADYLASRPDWDGRVLVVSGTSQGGFQCLVTAALHPKVTAALANVPAGSDNAGQKIEHAVTWPWFGPGKDSAGRDKDPQKVAETNPYFDAINFAPRIQCPVLVGVGLADQTCAPTGIFTTVNQIQSPKEIVVMPTAGHSGKNNAHAAYIGRCTVWLNALKDGRPAPVP